MEGWTVANPVFFNWIHSFLRSCLVSSRAPFLLSFLRILHSFFFCPSTCPLAAAAPEAGFSSCLSREDKCFSRKCLFQVLDHHSLKSGVVSRFTFLWLQVFRLLKLMIDQIVQNFLEWLLL